MSNYRIQVGDTALDIMYNTNGVAVYNVNVDVVRMTKINTALGITPTPVTVVTALPCAIKWVSGKEKYLFNKETHYLDAKLRCRVPAGITITNEDKIYYNSEYYEIVDLYDYENLGTLLVIGLKKIK